MTSSVRRAGEERRPTIEVHHPHDTDPELLRHLGAGIEEEGVPYSLVRRAPGAAAVIAAAHAARDSMLGVGIGIDEHGGIALAHSSFPPELPVLEHREPLTPEHARRMGQNAARVVTRVPLHL